MADGSYYTWVDAQGRIHNVPLKPGEEEPVEQPPGDDNDYQTEEEVQEKLAGVVRSI